MADIGIPGCDGYDLMRTIRALPDAQAQNMPALALTAYGGPDNRARALTAGFNEHLVKPVVLDALVRTVATLAGRLAPS